jgi:hypothetical protein
MIITFRDYNPSLCVRCLKPHLGYHVYRKPPGHGTLFKWFNIPDDSYGYCSSDCRDHYDDPIIEKNTGWKRK